MKANRPFWLTLAGALALVVVGYVGVVAFMPDKTAGGLQPAAFLLSTLVLVAGAVGLLGVVVYALVKAARERKRSRAAGV
jgi:hypothetical protein